MRSEENRGKMVAHAVQVEPVSIAEFPANREINRDIRQIGPREPISNPNTRAKLLTCGKIPYATEQAIILEEQGIRTQE
jgi:hypothetical protein